MGENLLQRMEATPKPQGPAWLEPMRRYVPLTIWIIVVMTILMIPAKIISYGYLPEDDALRHAAKAVSGKPWQDILVIGSAFRDQNFVWHDFLRQIHLWSHCGTDGLVVVEVVLLFALLGGSVLPWLKRPETWLITLILIAGGTNLIPRWMLGRPFLLTETGLMTILWGWQTSGSSPPGWKTATWIAAVIAICTLVHGVWYLWALPLVAFVLAGQFRWGFIYAVGWVAGVFGGALFTGHPIDSIDYAVSIALRTMGKHAIERTMSLELRPFNGDVFALIVFGGLLILRRLEEFKPRPLTSSPVFWMACVCWILGFKATRFWMDWGWPALMVLLTSDLQLLLASRLAVDSFRRLALAGSLALVAFLAFTSDVGSRWTANLTRQYLTPDNPDLKGWLPDKGGIFYAGEMRLFFQTFYKNPDADWRYMVGFEPALMPDEDYETYLNIYWNYGDAKSFLPWVKKMTPADRLVLRGGRGNTPKIPQLEWNYGVSGIWVGRLPGHQRPDDAPATIPATATMDSLTNSVGGK